MDPHQPPDDRDIDNPYAPPQSAFVREPLPALVAGIPFTVADIFNSSWVIFKEKLGLCMSIYWGAQGLNIGISLAMSLLIQGMAAVVRDPILYSLTYILVQFASVVVQVWLGIGQARAFVKIARGEPVAFDEIFKGGPFVLTTILASIIFFVILVVPISIAVGVSTAGFLAAGNQSIAGILLFLVASLFAGLFFIYISSRLVMYYYLIIDRNAGVFDSLQQSWQLCRNQVGTIVLVFFVQFAIIIAGFLALCVGVIFAVPLSALLLPVTYLALTGTRSAGPGKPEFLWEDDV